MGMTIDDHIEVLKSYHNGFTGYAGNLQDSIDVAVDIMRKYQKIQEIAEKCNLKLLPKEAMSTFMKDVLEVLEDGNDNY